MAAAAAGIRRLAGFVVFRYAAAGACATAANFLVRFPLSEFIRFEFAVTVAQIIGLSVGFWLYRTYVFRNAITGLSQQIATFLSVNLAAAIVVISTAIALRIVSGAGWIERRLRRTRRTRHRPGAGRASEFLRSFAGHIPQTALAACTKSGPRLIPVEAGRCGPSSCEKALKQKRRG